MKYLRIFNNNSDYQSFIEGDDYITPNICYVEETESLVAKPEKITFPLYIGDFNLVSDDEFQTIYTKEGNFTKLVNLLRSTVLSNGIEYGEHLILENLNDYGIEIYIDCEGVWDPITGLRLTFNNLYLRGRMSESYINENMIDLTIEKSSYEPIF
jgi:hypothetical protein